MASVVDYDRDADVLSLNRNRKVKESLELGEIVLDFDMKYFVSGVEILNASKNLNIPKSLLSNIQKAKMMIRRRPSSITVLIKLLSDGKVKEATTMIPMEARGSVSSTDWMEFAPVAG